DLWRTSDNVPICFQCRRPGHVTRYFLVRRRVFSAARQRRQLDQ
ncbi:CCHC-type domain-containing protein, partial [Trichonephila inaurata madagascariensis]